MNFDFASVPVIEDAVWFTVEHPVTGEELTVEGGGFVRIAMLGPDAAKMKALENKIQDRRLERVGKTGKLQLTASQIESENRDRALNSIVNWENFIIDGARVPFSMKALGDLLDKAPWLERFWEGKYRDAGNFLGSGESTPTS